MTESQDYPTTYGESFPYQISIISVEEFMGYSEESTCNLKKTRLYYASI
jgi:hypothetical protein